jgi:ankyrin repeat protein
MRKLVLFFACMVLVAGVSGVAWGFDIFIDSAKGDVFRVKRILEKDPSQATATDIDGNTPLHAAAGEGQGKMVEFLLNNGAKVNAKTKTGITALHDAASGGFKEVVEVLLDGGADVNARTEGGDTPLSLALAGGHDDVADLLREHGGKL